MNSDVDLVGVGISVGVLLVVVVEVVWKLNFVVVSVIIGGRISISRIRLIMIDMLIIGYSCVFVMCCVVG